MPFQYRARSEDAWKKRSEQSGSNYAGFIKDEFRTFSAKKDNWIRILPPTWEDPKHYGMDLWVHFGVGPDNGAVICLAKMGKGACPICEAQSRAEAAGRADAKELKPSRRVVVWVVDRKAEKKDQELFVWAMPWTCDRDISKICRDRQTGELYQIDHPEAGYDVTFDKEGEKLTTKYVGWQLARRSSPVDQSALNYVVEHPIPETFQWRTYDEVKALFEGEAVATPDGQPAPTAAVPAPVPAPPPPPPVTFTSEWLPTHCGIEGCGEQQYTTPTGLTCVNGHIDSISVEEIEEQATQAAPPTPPPPPAPPAAPPVTTRPTRPLVPTATPATASAAPVAAAPAAPAPTAAAQSRAAALKQRFTPKQ